MHKALDDAIGQISIVFKSIPFTVKAGPVSLDPFDSGFTQIYDCTAKSSLLFLLPCFAFLSLIFYSMHSASSSDLDMTTRHLDVLTKESNLEGIIV